MPIPLLDLTRGTPEFRAELENAVLEVVRSGVYILGTEVESFEREICDYVGVEHCIGLSSGTDALLAALMAIDVGPGDAVVLPTYTFFATAGVVHRLGATPVFVDVDPTMLNIDPAAVRRVLAERDDVKAVIGVHLFGAGCPIDELLAMTRDAGIPLIEDAAQSIGTRIDGRMAGGIGMCGCFSTFPSKNLGGIGDGGFLTTNDTEFATTIRASRNHGMTAGYHHEFVGGNFRLDAIQAAALRVKLRHLESMTEARRANAAFYADAFATKAGDAIQTPTDVDRHTYHQYVIRVPAAKRDAMLAQLRGNGIGCAVYYPMPLHLQPCFESLGGKPGDCPVAEDASARSIALPIWPDLREDERAAVVDAVLDALNA